MARRREVVIIGAGPAGIAAAIFLRRGGFDPLLLEMGAPGGLLRQADSVENYPGFPGGVSGPRLADLFTSHLKAVGCAITKAKVARVRRTEGGFVTSSSAGVFLSDAVIVAAGTKPRKVLLRGVKGSLGDRVFDDLYDLLAVSMAGERVVVYGGGDAAFDLGINLHRRGYRVTLLCRTRSRCLPLLRRRAEQLGVALVEGHSIDEVKGGKDGLELELGGGPSIDAGRVLIACGREPRLELLDQPLRDQIGPGGPLCSRVPGLYLAGDIAARGRRQVGIAVGSGMSAAMSAERYLRGEAVD